MATFGQRNRPAVAVVGEVCHCHHRVTTLGAQFTPTSSAVTDAQCCGRSTAIIADDPVAMDASSAGRAALPSTGVAPSRSSLSLQNLDPVGQARDPSAAPRWWRGWGQGGRRGSAIGGEALAGPAVAGRHRVRRDADRGDAGPMSRVTTELAPIRAPSPMMIGPRIWAPQPTITRLQGRMPLEVDLRVQVHRGRDAAKRHTLIKGDVVADLSHHHHAGAVMEAERSAARSSRRDKSRSPSAAVPTARPCAPAGKAGVAITRCSPAKTAGHAGPDRGQNLQAGPRGRVPGLEAVVYILFEAS